MWSEVGSDFWEYSIGEYENEEMFFWSNKNYKKQYLKSGRNAIKAICKVLSECKKKVMLPIYTCETVISPFIDEGWEVCFYKLNRDLSINENVFKHIYDTEQPSVVLVHSYFGFNTIKDELSLEYCKSKGAIIVEDMTQSLFSEHHIACADYYVASFRKFLAIPNGGVIASKRTLKNIIIKESDAEIDRVALKAFELKADYFKEETEEKKVAFREEYQSIAKIISKNDDIEEISAISKKIIFSCDFNLIADSRRNNYNMIFDALRELGYIKPVLNMELDDCVPLYLPVYVDDRESLQSFLRDEQIYCPIIWKKPSQVLIEDVETEYMYEHMLCIPIDQRYGSEEMNKIIKVLMNYVSSVECSCKSY